MTEVEFVKNDIKEQLLNIKEYIKPKYVGKNVVVMMDDAYVHYEPYGLALVIGAWNYPIQLCLCPLVGAITAGNCAIIKPSEIANSAQNLLAELIPKYLDNVCLTYLTYCVKIYFYRFSGVLSCDHRWSRSDAAITEREI